MCSPTLFTPTNRQHDQAGGSIISGAQNNLTNALRFRSVFCQRPYAHFI